MELIDMARECRLIVIKAVNDLGPDLMGYSVIDLCMDNIVKGSVSDIKAALVTAGVDNILSERLVRSYSK